MAIHFEPWCFCHSLFSQSLGLKSGEKWSSRVTHPPSSWKKITLAHVKLDLISSREMFFLRNDFNSTTHRQILHSSNAKPISTTHLATIPGGQFSSKPLKPPAVIISWSKHFLTPTFSNAYISWNDGQKLLDTCRPRQLLYCESM